MASGMDKIMAMKNAKAAAQVGSSVGKRWMAMNKDSNEITPTIPYHHAGTSGYDSIKREWISGSSFSEVLNLR
jgi:hypothetical protein